MLEDRVNMNRSSRAKRKNISKSFGLRTPDCDKSPRPQELSAGSPLMLNKYLAKANGNPVHIIIDEEAVVINLNKLYGLNSVGNFIWKQANGQTKVKQIIERICDEFEVDWQTAEEDCLKFLNTLISYRLAFLSENPG